ncbi:MULTISPECIES: hypothetical protein [unclassified Devosia]|nr:MULTISPECIES: hypothetical protein [unclassified Devosia]MBJ7578835.1 hypothetical protein [Devosia sp. MC532]MBK1793992.1 hypothetical protein [Devosia sp. WQ 349K1]
MKPENDMPTYDPHKSENEVRQGNSRKMNSRVLIVSLVAIVVLFAIVYLVNGAMQPPAS